MESPFVTKTPSIFETIPRGEEEVRVSTQGPWTRDVGQQPVARATRAVEGVS